MNASAAAQYRAQQQGSAHDIVERHGELVRRIAHHLAARLPASVEIDDLIQAGMLGLIDAGNRLLNPKPQQGTTATGTTKSS